MKGKFFIEREIFESDIWEKPPYFLKIWIWILGKANWKTVEKGGKVYHRGEFKTDYDKIIKENEWMVGWRTEKLKKDEVFNILEFLRKTQRITTRKATRGLWVEVVNYDYYQTLPSSENNSESNSEGNNPTTVSQQGKRKKDNNKEEGIAEVPSATKELISLFVEHCKKKRSFEPEIAWGKEGKLLKDKLKRFSADELKRCVVWFVNSEDWERMPSISAMLSSTVFNKWQEYRTKEKRLYEW